MTRRPDYIERRIDFHLARQQARREHPQPCDCGYCISTERIHEKLMANANKGRELWDEVPF